MEDLKFKLKSEAHACSTAAHGRNRPGGAGDGFLELQQVGREEMLFGILTQLHARLGKVTILSLSSYVT